LLNITFARVPGVQVGCPLRTLNQSMLFTFSHLINQMNIIITKLNPMTLSKELQRAFEVYGLVNIATVVMDEFSGRSNCFGFVEMPDAGEAAKAIEAMHESNLEGNVILVEEANPHDPRINKNFGRGIIYGDNKRTRF